MMLNARFSLRSNAGCKINHYPHPSPPPALQKSIAPLPVKGVNNATTANLTQPNYNQAIAAQLLLRQRKSTMACNRPRKRIFEGLEIFFVKKRQIRTQINILKQKIEERGGLVNETRIWRMDSTTHVVYSKGAEDREIIGDSALHGELHEFSPNKTRAKEDIRHMTIQHSVKRRRKNLNEIKVCLKGLSQFKEGVSKIQQLLYLRKGINLHLQ
ncbi:unnamed protein product, partial [Porites lobata]